MSIQLHTDEFVPTQRRAIADAMNELLDDFMISLVNFTIIAEIKLLAAASNLPRGFIDGISFRKTGPNEGLVVNTWGTKEKPLAVWFNHGTKRHWIQPVKAKALAWKGGGTHAQAIYFKGDSKKSDQLFSKGHYVSGVPRTEVMERGYQIGLKQLKIEAGKLIKKEFHYEQ